MIPKLDAFKLLYAGCPAVRIVLRTDRGVTVPPDLCKAPVTTLDVGAGLARPIADLVANEIGVYGTFSFGGAPFYCVVPWPAVFQLVGRADAHDVKSICAVMFWVDDTPVERSPPPPVAPPKKPARHLQLV